MLKVVEGNIAAWFSVPFPGQDGIKMKIRMFRQHELQKASEEGLVIVVEKGKKTKVEDSDKKREVFENLLISAVLDWKEIGDGSGNRLPCTTENVKNFLDQYGITKLDEVDDDGKPVNLTLWIQNIALDPSKFIDTDVTGLETTSPTTKRGGGTGMSPER